MMWRERESSRESALEKIKLRDEHSYTLPQKRNSAKTANTLICNQSEYFWSNPCVIVPLRDLVSPSRRAVQQPPPACRAARGFRSGINRGPRRPCQRRLIKFAALDPMRGSGRRLWRREVAVVAQTRRTTACKSAWCRAERVARVRSARRLAHFLFGSGLHLLDSLSQHSPQTHKTRTHKLDVHTASTRIERRTRWT